MKNSHRRAPWRSSTISSQVIRTWKPTLDSLTASLSPEEKYMIVAGNVVDYFDLDPDVLNKPE